MSNEPCDHPEKDCVQITDTALDSQWYCYKCNNHFMRFKKLEKDEVRDTETISGRGK